MNIFTIIGVVVVVILVAGYFEVQGLVLILWVPLKWMTATLTTTTRSRAIQCHRAWGINRP